MLQCVDFFPSTSACLWNGNGELLRDSRACSPAVQSYHVRSLLPAEFARQIAFRKSCQFFVTEDAGLSNKKVSTETLKHRCCVGAFCKITVWAHLGAPWPGCLTGRGISKTLPIFGTMAFTQLQKLQAEQDPTATSGSRLIFVLLGKRA